MANIPIRITELEAVLTNHVNEHEPHEIENMETELHWLRNIEELWDKLENHPYDPETECITEPYVIFPAGTHREEIWHWFEESFGISVAEDLMY